ncbi:MAG: DUF47 domain-containing protein [Macromonas sp.]
MLFGKLLPREGNFFEMFNQHADHIVVAAHALSNMVACYSDLSEREKHNQTVDKAERAADHVTQQINHLVHQTFITPIDREQIHGLINGMDEVLDLIQDCAESMALYDVRHITDEIRRLTDINVQCCERLQSAMTLLGKVSNAANAETVLKTCADIDQLESDANRVLRVAMGNLFRDEQDVREVIKLKAVYELLESITDQCEDVANLIEGVVLENS